MDHEIIFLASAIATIVGTIVAIIVTSIAYWKFLTEKNAEKRRASENLYTELKDALAALDDDNLKNWIYVDIKREKESTKRLYFVNRIFNHDFYDSLIFSGKLTFLEPTIPQPIQDIFRQIKTHNEYLMHVDHLVEKQDDGTVPADAYRYCEWMHENEPKLEQLIQNMIKELKQYFKMRPEV